MYAHPHQVNELTQYYYADHVITISAADSATILGSLHAGRSMHPSRFTPWRHVFAEEQPISAVWRGVAWRGVVWRGVAWRGVAWRGVA